MSEFDPAAVYRRLQDNNIPVQGVNLDGHIIFSIPGYVPTITEHQIIAQALSDYGFSYDAIQMWLAAKANMELETGWKSFTATEAETYIVSNVLSGYTKAQVDIVIANVISWATARTALTQLAYAIIDLRAIVSKMARVITYFRDLILVKIRE